MNNIEELAFIELKKWYITNVKSYRTFIELRDQYMVRHGHTNPLTASVAFSKTGLGIELLGDWKDSRDMVMINALTLIASKMYEESYKASIDEYL